MSDKKQARIHTPRAKDFARIAAQVKDWMTTEDIITLCDEQNFWPYEFLENAIHSIKKVAVRNLARKRDYKDDDGNPIELVSIIQRNEAAEKDERAYKQLSLFDRRDYIQVIADRWRRRKYWDDEIRRFVRLAIENHGEGIQAMLPFLPDDFLSEAGPCRP